MGNGALDVIVDPDARRAVAVRVLAVDSTTVTVIARFEQEGIDVLLLKGPSFGELLYPPGALRPYGDTDLLVSCESRIHAQAVLQDLGFEPTATSRPVDPALEDVHAWHANGRYVDLHDVLKGCTAPQAAVWDALWADRVPLVVAGTSVPALDVTSRLLHVTLHAAHHGHRSVGVKNDLERALARFGSREWNEVDARAKQFGARVAFAHGLRIVPAGRQLADRFGLPTGGPVTNVLEAMSAPPGSIGWEALSRQPSLVRQLRYGLRRVFLTQFELRHRYPEAASGLAAASAARVKRVARVAWCAVPGFRSWQRARRISRQGGTSASDRV